ncbi:MAG: hypothetical protein MUC79_16405 [Thiobacillaceae bacterium]|jgi:hypothetical protein|nr:hypothetical protein [Thiobacillaceae bacterium]
MDATWAPSGEHAAALAEAIGAAGLARLVQHYGGMRIRIHTDPRPESDLAERLGPEVYSRLQAIYAGEEIDIPRLRSEQAAARAARVQALRAKGWTGNEIARAEGLTLRQVRRLLAQEAPPVVQMDLFG